MTSERDQPYNELMTNRFENEDDLRRALVECGRILYERRLLTANDGNLSARLNDAQLIITAAGVCKGRMRPQDLIVINMQGGISGSGATGRVSSETPMHLEVYLQRPDVNAVIHAHPVFATALSVAGLEFPSDMLPEGVMSLGEVPTTQFAAPASTEDADVVRGLIGQHDALLLRQHGTLTCGPDLEAALILLERIEYVAEVFHRARALGHVQRLSADDRARLEQIRDSLKTS